MSPARVTEEQARALGVPVEPAKTRHVRELVGMVRRWAEAREVQLTIHADPFIVGGDTGEFKFALALDRHWKFDIFVWELGVAIEYEGGAGVPQGKTKAGKAKGSRHSSPAGFAEDVEKYGIAQAMGYKVVRIAPATIRSGLAELLIRWTLTRANLGRNWTVADLTHNSAAMVHYEKEYSQFHTRRKERKKKRRERAGLYGHHTAPAGWRQKPKGGKNGTET